MNLRKLFFLIVVVLMALPLFAMPREVEAAAGRRIVVDISDQRVYAYNGATLVKSIPANARGTRGGNFRIRNKIPMARSYVLGWRLPYWMGIYMSGGLENGFHGTAITRNGGRASNSLGCIVMSTANAQWLYSWTRVGTPVTVRR
jgi:lipoprotein-anchoring transpeptidase ErfK/SrfK